MDVVNILFATEVLRQTTQNVKECKKSPINIKEPDHNCNTLGGVLIRSGCDLR